MRTTLTLDDDVAALLRRAQVATKAGLKEIVNEALRVGLAHVQARRRPAARYRMPVVDLGECLIGSLDDVAEALAIAEGEDHR